METSVPWSKIKSTCDAATEKLNELHEKYNFPGKPYMSYRIPQIYHTGVLKGSPMQKIYLAPSNMKFEKSLWKMVDPFPIIMV